MHIDELSHLRYGILNGPFSFLITSLLDLIVYPPMYGVHTQILGTWRRHCCSVAGSIGRLQGYKVGLVIRRL